MCVCVCVCVFVCRGGITFVSVDSISRVHCTRVCECSTFGCLGELIAYKCLAICSLVSTVAGAAVAHSRPGIHHSTFVVCTRLVRRPLSS